MEEFLTFDDVCLIPKFSNIASRTEPDLSTQLTKKIRVGMPLVPANMDTVMGPELAHVVIKNGGVPIFHRFTNVQTQLGWIDAFKGNIFISAGLNNWDSIYKLLDNGPLGIVLDVAHGHSQTMLDAIKKIKNDFAHIQIIAGNVCTAIACQDLINAGADAVKVGVGPGSACLTRVVTGFGSPQFSTIRECAEVAKRMKVPIIADGGIRNSRDLVLALAAGASTAMMGKLFALTEESAAEKRLASPSNTVFGGRQLEAKYRGQASEDFQNEFYGGLKDKTVAEGTAFWSLVSGPAQELIDTLLGGLRSGMTYGGGRTIGELQEKAEFKKVTYSYIAESYPRP